LAWQNEGVVLRICTTRLGSNPALAGLKHLNRLEQVLARAEWGESDGIQEGLMLDAEGSVVEGTMTNLFAAPSGGPLLTPDLSHAGVAGVMRRHIIEQAAVAGIQVQVRRINPGELMDQHELFVCNSLIGVWPVACLGERRYTVGPLTRLAQKWASAA
jgi:4-amino-4-deoxychorismate lyase